MGAISVARGIRECPGAHSVEDMDVSSMIMGGAIASIAWIAFYPWAQMRRLREIDAQAAAEAGEAGQGTTER